MASSGGIMRDVDYSSSTLPGGTFARAIFDARLVRASDRGGASQLIGDAWSDVAARTLDEWADHRSSPEIAAFNGIEIQHVYRLDTIPGVAARASKAGLKSPDFLVFATRANRPVVFGVDAKFSVETARPVQVSAETTEKLFNADVRLNAMLPDIEPDSVYDDGMFLSPDYSLTHAMFRHKVGHRRLTVSPNDVVLIESDAEAMFGDTPDRSLLEQLCRIDDLPFSVWESLLAAQYYFRLARAVAGIAADERKPLLGPARSDFPEVNLADLVGKRSARTESAWQMVLDWDSEVEHLRRQRQALHQVIGSPLSSAELRQVSDEVMDALGLVRRPSRNKVRRALGGRFGSDVLAKVGVIEPPVADFPATLERVGSAAREVSAIYNDDIREILEEIVLELNNARPQKPATTLDSP